MSDCKTRLVLNVPSQGGEEWIEELSSKLSFIVLAGFVSFDMLIESLNQGEDFGRTRDGL